MKKSFMFCAVASVLASGSMAAHAGQQFWVTKKADTFNGRCTPQDCSLRDAINAANNAPPGNNTIGFLFGGTYPIERPADDGTKVILDPYTIDDETGDIGDFDLWSRITIEGLALDGKKVTVDGQHGSRVFDIHADAYVVLNNLTITGGYLRSGNVWYQALEELSGAGIRNAGTLLMDSCEVSFNRGGIFASALYNYSTSETQPGQATVTNSQFLFNQAVEDSPVRKMDWNGHESTIYSTGASGVLKIINGKKWHVGVINPDTSLVLSDSTVAFNTSEQIAAVGVASRWANFAMYRTKVINNKFLTQSAGGQAVYIAGTPKNTTATIEDSEISNNDGTGLRWLQGSDNHLVIRGTTFANNRSEGDGGGIYFDLVAPGDPQISNSTISGNVAKGHGGGILVATNIPDPSYDELSHVFLNNVTIANNTSGLEGGGIFEELGRADLKNTLITDNHAGIGSGNDCYGVLRSDDYNLISDRQGCRLNGPTANSIFGVSAQLEPLKDNGGPSPTHALLTTSPAFDAGNDATCKATDQRGVARPQWQHCDMGAYESTTPRSPGG